MKLGLIVEGHGDVESMPILIRSALHYLDFYNFTIEPPIRIGEFNVIMKNERFIRFLQSLMNNDDIDAIIVACDLDDLCPVEARRSLIYRISDRIYNSHKPIGIIFINREFESLFLSQLDILLQRENIDIHDINVVNAAIARSTEVRAAKAFFAHFFPNLNYKESRDQARFTALLDPSHLADRHRAGRRLLDVLRRMIGGVGDIAAPN